MIKKERMLRELDAAINHFSNEVRHSDPRNLKDLQEIKNMRQAVMDARLLVDTFTLERLRVVLRAARSHDALVPAPEPEQTKMF